MAITTADLPAIAPPARLLDLTRLVRRAGRRMTGIDRVEFAYLTHLLDASVPLWGIVRSSLGFVLLDQSGCWGLRDRLVSGVWGAPDRLSGISRALDETGRRVESDLRRLCHARCLPIRLTRMLQHHLPACTVYLNTGHTNFSARMISAVGRVKGSRIAVLVHDTIPLDHPEFQRPKTTQRFAVFLKRVARFADLVICNSGQTRRDVLRHADLSTEQVIVAHLGVPRIEPGNPPRGAWTDQPYFVVLGTIEPRKNHALLLDLWSDVSDAHLLICGQRGWQNRTVFERLDVKPQRVHELPNLSDSEITALLHGACALLQPSFAEGFGLPPLEAASLGVTVILSDLPVYHDVMGDYPTYLKPDDSSAWRDAISRRALVCMGGLTDDTAMRRKVIEPPSWDAHFKTVLTLI